MTWCVIKKEEASHKSICLGFEDIDGMVNLYQKLCARKSTIMILSCSKKNASFSVNAMNDL